MNTANQMTAESAQQKDGYLAQFEALERELRSAGRSSWLIPARETAMARFVEKGFPTTRDERWRFTSIAPITSRRFLPADGPGTDAGARTGVVERLTIEGACARVVLVDGRFDAGLSRLEGLPAGAIAGGLSNALDRERGEIEPRITKLPGAPDQAFAALNSALFRDGAYIRISPRTVVPGPIQLIFLSSGPPAGSPAAVSYPRILVIAGEGSQASILETWQGPGGGVYMTNAVSEIDLAAGAVIDHVKLQIEGGAAFHMAGQHVRLGRDASFRSTSVSLGAALSRNDIVATLEGDGSSCTLNGLYLVSGAQHVDYHTTLDHAAPHGTSRELYKGILAGRARGVFDGGVIVRSGAQKTDSKQTNRNLLLSVDALVDTKPQLEINADDVKCAHAATIGRLDETSLFYLRSRGLDLREARRLMVQAFAAEVTGCVSVDPLRSAVREAIAGPIEGLLASAAAS